MRTHSIEDITYNTSSKHPQLEHVSSIECVLYRLYRMCSLSTRNWSTGAWRVKPRCALNGSCCSCFLNGDVNGCTVVVPLSFVLRPLSAQVFSSVKSKRLQRQSPPTCLFLSTGKKKKCQCPPPCLFLSKSLKRQCPSVCTM